MLADVKDGGCAGCCHIGSTQSLSGAVRVFPGDSNEP
jgi:hypothetical protein